jgi:hypothetical protein
MHLAAPHEATGDLGGLMARARRGGMGREVTRGGDQDRGDLRVALPGEALLHGRLQVLQHVEAGILPQDRVAQNCNEVGGPPAGGEVGRSELGGLRYLLLSVAGVQEGAAKLGRRRGRFLAMRQSRRGNIEVAIKVDRERAMERCAQAQGLSRHQPRRWSPG